jgi:hypothetical protein
VRSVFRPDAQWAVALIALILSLPIISIGGFADSGTFTTGQLTVAWFWVARQRNSDLSTLGLTARNGLGLMLLDLEAKSPHPAEPGEV